MNEAEVQKIFGEFRKLIDKRLTEEVLSELVHPPGRQGFTGLLSVFDEWIVPLDQTSWTPEQFDLIWESYSQNRRIQFVKNLMKGWG